MIIDIIINSALKIITAVKPSFACIKLVQLSATIDPTVALAIKNEIKRGEGNFNKSEPYDIEDEKIVEQPKPSREIKI